MLERFEGREKAIVIVVACAAVSATAYAVYKFVKSREDAKKEEPQPVVSVEKPDIFSIIYGSDTDGDLPPYKAPDESTYDEYAESMVQTLWSKADEEEDAVETPKPQPKTVISKKDWFELKEQDEYVDHAATYFWQDDIFAGIDDQLDILDKEESFGGIPMEAYDEASDKGGAYVLCGDGVTLLEIYGSDGNYLEELKAVYANMD